MVRHDHLRNVRLNASIFGALVALGALVTPAGADMSSGIALIRDSTKGNCSICHLIPGIGLPEEAQGNIGPALEGVGSRLSPEELADQVVDARRINPESVMPPYGTTEGFVDVDHRYLGRPILTDSEIAAIVSYLSSLR
jgi:L-cysteine S-thiosulfotransferase